MGKIDDVVSLLEYWLEEIKIKRTKRVPSRVRIKRKRYYRKHKASIKRRSKRRARRPRTKRLNKRRAKIRKRLHLKPGSRRRVQLSGMEFTTGRLMEAALTQKDQLIEGFTKVAQLIDELIELKDEPKLESIEINDPVAAIGKFNLDEHFKVLMPQLSEAKKVTVYDNGGKTFDRYTVVVDGGDEKEFYGMGKDPSKFNQFSGTDKDGLEEGPHLGRKISVKALPSGVQDAIKERVGTDKVEEKEETQLESLRTDALYLSNQVKDDKISLDEATELLEMFGKRLDALCEEEEEPSEEDIVIAPAGRLGSQVSVGVVGGKHIGTFNSNDEAEDAIKEYMEKHKFYPQVWFQDDHGGVSKYQMEGLSEIAVKVPNAGIPIDKVKKAMELVKDGSVSKLAVRGGPVENQLAHSLQVYKNRGEYDGSLESAIESLLLAGYEIEGHEREKEYFDKAPLDRSITQDTIVKVLKPNSKNIYSDGTEGEDEPLHHVFIDVYGLASQEPTTVGQIMKTHEQPLEYYQDHLPTLVRDGLIELQKGVKEEGTEQQIDEAKLFFDKTPYSIAAFADNALEKIGKGHHPTSLSTGKLRHEFTKALSDHFEQMVKKDRKFKKDLEDQDMDMRHALNHEADEFLRKWLKSHKTEESVMTERAGKSFIENHPELAEKLKDAIEDGGGDIDRKYETDGSIEEVEHLSRPGFASTSDGGYSFTAFAPLMHMIGSGSVSSLPDKAEKQVQKMYDYGVEIAQEQFIEEYKEELKDIPKDKINYHDLYDLKLGSLAEKLSEMEYEANADDTVMLMLQAFMEDETDRDQGVSFTVQGVVNWESPYHRSGKDREEYKQITVNFKDHEDMTQNFDKVLKAVKECAEFVEGVGSGGKTQVEDIGDAKDLGEVKKKEVSIFSFEELDPKVQAKVLDKFRDAQFEADLITEGFEEDLKYWGLPKPKVYWSLSSSQGDGVAFEGKLDLNTFLKGTKFHNNPEIESIEIVHKGRYYHSNSMDVDINAGPNLSDEDYKELLELCKEKIKDMSHNLEKIGYSQIEYMQSDESVKEFLDANEYEFYSNGDVAIHESVKSNLKEAKVDFKFLKHLQDTKPKLGHSYKLKGMWDHVDEKTSELWVNHKGEPEIIMFWDTDKFFSDHLDKDQNLTDKIQKDFEDYDGGGWADWREEWVKKQGWKVGELGSGNTYNEDNYYFWGDVFEFTDFKTSDGKEGVVIMKHIGGDVRGNYEYPEVYMGDFMDVYSSLSVGDPDEEKAQLFGYDGDAKALKADLDAWLAPVLPGGKKESVEEAKKKEKWVIRDTAVRDNSRDQLISIGKAIDSGEDLDEASPQKKKALADFRQPDFDLADFTIGKTNAIGGNFFELNVSIPVDVDFLKKEGTGELVHAVHEFVGKKLGVFLGTPSVGGLNDRAKGGMRTITVGWNIDDPILAYSLGADLTAFSGSEPVVSSKEEMKKRHDYAEKATKDAIAFKKNALKELESVPKDEQDKVWTEKYRPEFVKMTDAMKENGLAFHIAKAGIREDSDQPVEEAKPKMSANDKKTYEGQMKQLAHDANLSYDGHNDDRMFYDNDMIGVFASLMTKKEYSDMEKDMKKYKVKGDGYEIYAWNDHSGYEYWKERAEDGDSNYIQVTAAISDPKIVNAEKLKQDMEEAFDYFHGKYDNKEEFYSSYTPGR